MKKGFTLLELLIVIAILAILSTVIVFTLDPLETMKKARDVQRISDLNSVKSAIQLFLIETGTTSAAVQCGAPMTCSSTQSMANTPALNWLHVDFTTMPSGSPISRVPIDPINNATYYYYFRSSTTAAIFELDCKLESKYYTTGDTRIDNKDGGNNADRYETGSDLTLLSRAVLFVKNLIKK